MPEIFYEEPLVQVLLENPEEGNPPEEEQSSSSEDEALPLPADPPIQRVISSRQIESNWHIAHSVFSITFNILLFCTTFFALYLEDEELKPTPAMSYSMLLSGLTALIFCFGIILNSVANKLARDELDHAKRNYENTIRDRPHIANVTPTQNFWKTYGTRKASNHVIYPVRLTLALFNVGSNVINIMIKLGYGKQDWLTYVIVGNLASMVFEWVHQGVISHNLIYEKKLYEAAEHDILTRLTNPPINADLLEQIIFRR